MNEAETRAEPIDPALRTSGRGVVHAKCTPVMSAISAQCGPVFLPENDFTAISPRQALTPRLWLPTLRP